jgi:hypothetical protein
MARIRTNVSNLSDAELAVKANFILKCLEGNTYFPNPIPTLAEVKAGLDDFTAALANRGTGKEQTIIKNKARATLLSLLTDLALNVQLSSKGDELALESSGFDVITRRSAVGVLPKPVNFIAKPTELPGSIKLSMKTIDGAKAYMYEYTPMPVTDDSQWLSTLASRASVTINDLISGSQYSFRAVGIGADPTLVYSDNISSYVL